MSTTRQWQASADKARQRPADIPHGTKSGYRYWACRCPACANANRLSAAATTARQRVRDGKPLSEYLRQVLEAAP